MKRKAKAFWIGSFAPGIALWVWWYLAQAWVSPPMDSWPALILTGPAIAVGGLAGMIASRCTSGPPMSRKAKAGLIGFYAPVIPGSGLVMLWYVTFVRSDHALVNLVNLTAMLFAGVLSILLGLAIALIATSLTRNKPDPLKCGKCGYSLVGLTSDKCPECGQELSARAKP